MNGRQRIESLITVNPRGRHLTLGEPQLSPLPNGAIRTSHLGLLWNGVTMRRIHRIPGMAVTVLGVHPV